VRTDPPWDLQVFPGQEMRSEHLNSICSRTVIQRYRQGAPFVNAQKLMVWYPRERKEDTAAAGMAALQTEFFC